MEKTRVRDSDMKVEETLKVKVWDLDLQMLSEKAQNVQAIAHTLNKAIQSEQLDTEYITDVVNVMAGFAIDIVNKVGEMEAS
ncbi:hypothetical protein [Leuconostoc suionicum]|uniref:hypothetical protein n=1 Tax=Leuconostoc suionicum TaxID=1511761 RepID=UPI0032DF172B